jgi:SAM-dependent methyltransferase
MASGQKHAMFDSALFWRSVGLQLKCPSGWPGRLLGHIMALVNLQPNRLAIDALGINPTDTILEIGFGPGQGIKRLATAASQGTILGIDQSPEMLVQASLNNRRAIERGRVRLSLGRFDTLPCQSATVDKILAVNVVYFFQESAQEIREAKRALRPGGVMAIYATDKSTMSRWQFSRSDTHSHFDQDDLRVFVMRGGFCADEVSVRSLTLAFGVKGLLAILRKGQDSAPYCKE